MGINGSNGKEIIKLSTLWELAFKLLLVSVPLFLSLLLTWGIWVTKMLIDHDKEIYAIMKEKASIVSSQ